MNPKLIELFDLFKNLRNMQVIVEEILTLDYYVYNFDNPNQPLAIALPAGLGKVFVKDMEDLIKTVSAEIPKAFDNNEYENEKNRILQEFQDLIEVFL